jgi:hypothetical protein
VTGGHWHEIDQREGSQRIDDPLSRLVHSPGHQDLQELYSATLGILRDSAAQFEEIQKTLSEFLERSKAVDEPQSPVRKTRLHRQREQRRRTEIDLGLKVRSPSASFPTTYVQGEGGSTPACTVDAGAGQHLVAGAKSPRPTGYRAI